MADDTTNKRWPGESDEAHPDTFNVAPPRVGPKKPGQLTDEQIKHFFEKGYLVVDQFFDLKDLDACRRDIEIKVEEVAQKLYKGGKIKQLYSELGFFERLTAIEKEFPGANVILHKDGYMPKVINISRELIRICDVWSNEKLLNLVEQILGTSDIVGNPVWNLRTKTPQNQVTTVPWHQDNAYMDKEIYKHMLLTAWIPLLDANEQNGCMQLVPEGHKTGRTAKHQCCHGGTWYVMLEEDEMKKTLDVDVADAVTCPIPYGGMLLFSNVLPHRSLPNTSQEIRWSMDLRWQSANSPVGFYGLKDGVRLRSSDPNFKSVDWNKFNATDRVAEQFKSLNLEYDEFDTTIQGPWMGKWEIVHVNKHTVAYKENEDQPLQMPIVVG